MTMRDLDEQIRRYVDGVAPSIGVDELRREPLKTRRLVPALAGAAVVLAAVAVVVVPHGQSPSVSGYEVSVARSQKADAIVFLTEDVTSAQLDAIAHRFDSLPYVRGYVYVDQEATYAEFETMFSDEPSLLENVDPSVLPTSFRVDLKRRSDGEELVDALADMAGVRKVVLSPSWVSTAAARALFRWWPVILLGIMAVVWLVVWRGRRRRARMA